MALILVVDDDVDTCRFLVDILAGLQHRIETEHDPATALRRVTSAPLVDLLVSDLQLNSPVSGLDIVQAFLLARPAGKAVVITAFGNSDVEQAVRQSGALAMVSKPFEVGDLRELIRQTLDAPGRPVH